MVQRIVKLKKLINVSLNPAIIIARPSDKGKVYARFQPSEDEYFLILLDSETVTKILNKRSELKVLLESEITVKGTIVEHKKRVKRNETIEVEIWEEVE